MDKLLSRDEFRNAVFSRDNYKCVVCGEPAVDAHHIMERRLWPDGGYYINNGASLCEKHHIEAEETNLGVDFIRLMCKITKPIIPPHLYDDVTYDKWANIVLITGLRLKGELFFDESVQKILKQGNVLQYFTKYVKYPRTYHLPWSNVGKDDRTIESTSIFEGKQVVVTEKMDGENTTLYNDYIHARSLDGRNHSSRDWVKNFWSQFNYEIPENWRICGENLYAKHSIHYLNLKSYFMGFSIWDEKNTCLSWDSTVEWFKLLNIEPVPVLYTGIYNEELIKKLHTSKMYDTCEGYVVRLASEFNYADFRHSVAKYVRQNHVTSDQHHWFAKEVIPNQLSL